MSSTPIGQRLSTLHALGLSRNVRGTATRADRAGTPDGLLTRKELDDFIAANPGHRFAPALAPALELPEAKPLRVRDLGGPRLETREVPGEASTWIGLDELPPDLRRVAEAVISLAAGDDSDVGSRHVSRHRFEPEAIERPLVDWADDNFDAFFAEGDWVGPEAELRAGLDGLRAAIDRLAEPSKETVLVLPEALTGQPLPVKHVHIDLARDIGVAFGRRDRNKGKTFERRHLEIRERPGLDVVIHELPAEGAVGRAATKPWQMHIEPHGANFAVPPNLGRGGDSKLWIQVFRQKDGELLENVRVDVPKVARPRLDVDLTKMRVEDTRGRDVYFR